MNLDPETEEGLRRLLRVETRRINQQNFAWKAGAFIGCLFVIGYALAFLCVIVAGSGHSYSGASSSAYSGPVAQYTPPTVEELRAQAEETEKANHALDVRLSNGDVYTSRVHSPYSPW
jgi:hypothetical protein